MEKNCRNAQRLLPEVEMKLKINNGIKIAKHNSRFYVNLILSYRDQLLSLKTIEEPQSISFSYERHGFTIKFALTSDLVKSYLQRQVDPE